MTPEEFDRVYFDLAEALGDAGNPVLLRDRLLLLALQDLSFDRARALIAEARLSVPIEDLKRGVPPGELHRMAHTHDRIRHETR